MQERFAEILHDLCAYKGVEIIEGHLMPDHVHMLVSIPPKLSVSSFMGYLKGKSSLMMFDRHANLKYKFGNRHFWAEGYYVSTVGLNDATVKKYIRDQERTDIIKDKMSVKNMKILSGRSLERITVRTSKMAPLGADRRYLQCGLSGAPGRKPLEPQRESQRL